MTPVWDQIRHEKIKCRMTIKYRKQKILPLHKRNQHKDQEWSVEVCQSILSSRITVVIMSWHILLYQFNIVTKACVVFMVIWERLVWRLVQTCLSFSCLFSVWSLSDLCQVAFIYWNAVGTYSVVFTTQKINTGSENQLTT